MAYIPGPEAIPMPRGTATITLENKEGDGGYFFVNPDERDWPIISGLIERYGYKIKQENHPTEVK